MVVVLVVGALAGLGTYVVRQREPTTFTATARLESMPGSVWGLRALQDHYVEVLGEDSDVATPIDIPKSTIVTVDGLEPWDQFFVIQATSERESDALSTVEAIVDWVIADSLAANRASDDRDITSLTAESSTTEAEFAAADRVATSAPDDPDLRHARDALRNRLTSLSQRLDDATARAQSRVTSVAVVRTPRVDEDDTPADDALVAAVVGLLLATTAVVAFRP